MTARRDGDADMRIDVTGHVVGAVVVELQVLITRVILVERPGALVINLHDVTALDVAGAWVLMSGYLTAMDHGTSYRVLDVHGQARDVLQATGIVDVLADSDDVGALMVAVLTSRPLGVHDHEPG